MLSENYAKLDDLAGPDSFVTPPSQTDLAYILHFQKSVNATISTLQQQMRMSGIL